MSQHPHQRWAPGYTQSTSEVVLFEVSYEHTNCEYLDKEEELPIVAVDQAVSIVANAALPPIPNMYTAAIPDGFWVALVSDSMPAHLISPGSLRSRSWRPPRRRRKIHSYSQGWVGRSKNADFTICCFRAHALETLRKVVLVYSWILVRGEGDALEINAAR